MARDVFGLDPVNRTANVVTGQSGCASDGTLNNEQMRENLVSKVKSIQHRLLLMKKCPERKLLGKEVHALQLQINRIRPAKKAKGVENFFIDAAKEKLTKPQFDIVMTAAVKMLRK